MVRDKLIISLGDPSWQFALVKQRQLTLKSLIDELKLNESSWKQVKHMQQVNQEAPKAMYTSAVHNIRVKEKESASRKSREKKYSKYRKQYGSSDSSDCSRTPSPRVRRGSPRWRSKTDRSQTSSDSEAREGTPCTRCGRSHGNTRCPAKGQVCDLCNKIGHFQKVCFSRSR